MELKGKKINFLGDSITEGAAVADREHNIYWQRVGIQEGAITRGYGIGGTRIAKKRVPSNIARHDLDFIKRADDMDPDADVIVVFGGTNDFGHGDAPIGKCTDRTEYTFYGALHVLCNKLIEKYPAAQIVFMTPLHRLSEDNMINENGQPLETNLEGFRNIIIEVARYYSIPVLDLWAVSGLQPKVDIIKQTYMKDGLHPNDLGHKMIADKLIGFLKTL